MKRFFLVITACAALMFATSSCRWYHENITTVEECAEWYCEQMLEASNDEDDAKLEELATQLSEWVERLTADEALLVWLTVETWFNDRGDSLFDNLEDYYEEEEDLYW